MTDDQLQSDLAACLGEWSKIYAYKDGAIIFSGLTETETEAKAFEFGGTTAEGSNMFVCVDRRVFEAAVVSHGPLLETQLVLSKESALGSVDGLPLWVLRSVDPRPDMSSRLNFTPVT